MSALDVRVFLALHDALAAFILPLAVLSAIGGGWGSLSVIPIYAHPRSRFIARPLVVVLATTALAVFVLKRVFARTRPFASLDNIKPLVFAPPNDYSFPSGHAAGSFAFAVFFALVLWKRGRAARITAIVLLLLAVGVGLSRIALGVHFPGDVLAGAALGTTVAILGARAAVLA